MARERTIPKHEALDRLTDAFTVHGYGTTSLSMLQEATGLGKQSLYNTFGDKQAMYLQALECVVQRAANMIAAAQAAPDGRSAVVAYFDAMVCACASNDPVQRSCIFTNALLEGVDDPVVKGVLVERWHTTHEVLRAEVERGQRDGSIANRSPSSELAELLVSLTAGLRVGATVGRSRAQLMRLVTLTLSVLDSPD